MIDQEHVQQYLVTVPTIGDPVVERDRLMVSVGRALHHMVKPGCTIQYVREVDKPVEVARSAVGPAMVFDPKGDDMGNHGPEHDRPLVPFNAFALEDDCDADD